MIIFKNIHVFNEQGSLIGMIPYIRNIEAGEISVTALGAENDSLDKAIKEAVGKRYPNLQFYHNQEMNEDQIAGNLKSYGKSGTETLTLCLIHGKVFQVPLTLWVSEKLHPQEREKIRSEIIEYKTEQAISDRQVSSLKAL